MEILLNELSLTGQFVTVDEFTLALKEIIKTLKGISHKKYFLLKKYDFYSSPITSSETFHAVLTGKHSRENDVIRRYKSLLCSFLDSPYWEENQKHSKEQSYFYKDKNINGSSLAEACERDGVVLSFRHNEFKLKLISVLKNKQSIELFNLVNFQSFYDVLSQKKLLSIEEEFIFRFPDTLLNFSELNKEFGFGLLTDSDIKNAFLSTFEKFVQMKWPDIQKDGGLQYKPYNDPAIFKADFQGKRIWKFRVSGKCRCFGYREGDTFFVVRFEIDHKLSDKG